MLPLQCETSSQRLHNWLALRNFSFSPTNFKLNTVAMAAKQHRIFDIAELLERIFLALPFASIVRVQGICRKWNDVIAACPQVQVALFYAPESDTKAKLKRGQYLHTFRARTPVTDSNRPPTKECRD